MVDFGVVREYKIGEIAKSAGVSKRTIDYYTNFGLLKPIRYDNNYRYYSEESFLRLRLIEEMKKRRLTLEEIKGQLDMLGSSSLEDSTKDIKSSLSPAALKDHFNLLMGQMLLLKPLMFKLDQVDINLASTAAREYLNESLSLVQELINFINHLGNLFY